MMEKIKKILNQKISYLRFFIYLFVAFAFIATSLIIFWSKSTYSEPSNIYYSQPPRQLKSFLYLSPGEGRYAVGDEFDIDVLINTAGSNVVATAAYLSYNKEALEAVSIDTSDSVFNMEAEKEIISEQGKIKITLGKPTPGVKGNAGKIATVRFRSIKKTHPVIDNISFDFTKGSSLYSTIILDDKKGTNILSVTRGSRIIIN